MKYTLDIDINNAKAKALLNYIATLDFVRVSENSESSIKSNNIDKALDIAHLLTYTFPVKHLSSYKTTLYIFGNILIFFLL